MTTTFRTKGDKLIALNCESGKPIVLTNRRLIDLEGPKRRSVGLSEELPTGVPYSIHPAGNQLFAGIDAGEWGGGLRRIDRRSGKMGIIERNVSGELCGGPLNTGCDPVNGITSEPGHPGCVVVAIGLVHFLTDGRLVEVCGNRVKELYVKPYGEEPPEPGTKKGDKPFQTVPFFGLTREGQTLWAVGIDGIYRVEKGEVTQIVPLPHLKRIGGFEVSFALPRLVLVYTSVNQRHSVSGSVPMLISR